MPVSNLVEYLCYTGFLHSVAMCAFRLIHFALHFSAHAVDTNEEPPRIVVLASYRFHTSVIGCVVLRGFHLTHSALHFRWMVRLCR